jgi:uncharacterized protein involved in cysteine biosynthesis
VNTPNLPITKPLPSGVRGFVAGFSAFLVGLKLVLPGGGLFKFAIAPVLISGFVLVGLALGAFFGVAGWLTTELSEQQWLAWLGGFAAFLITLLLAYFLFTPVMQLFGPAFMDPICEQVHRKYTGQTLIGERSAQAWVFRQLWAIVPSLKWLVVSICIQVPLTIIGLLTVVGLVIAVPINAIIQGADLMDNPLGCREWPFKRRLGWYKANFAATLGLGTASSLVLLVPGLNLFMLPAGVAAATLMMLAEERQGGTQQPEAPARPE